MLLKEDDLKGLDRRYRLNLINSVTGVKPANLIGTRSEDHQDNLAIFSSVVHLDSNPAQIGMITRPQGEILKDTYANILATGKYSINHVTKSCIEKAHYTSAKLEKEVSEFDRMNIKREFIGDFHAPFVADSSVKLGMRLLQNISLPNGCIFIVGEVELAIIPDSSINELGQIDLEKSDAVGISGLNSYYSLKKITTLPYVRTNEIPEFNG